MQKIKLLPSQIYILLFGLSKPVFEVNEFASFLSRLLCRNTQLTAQNCFCKPFGIWFSSFPDASDAFSKLFPHETFLRLGQRHLSNEELVKLNPFAKQKILLQFCLIHSVQIMSSCTTFLMAKTDKLTSYKLVYHEFNQFMKLMY